MKTVDEGDAPLLVSLSSSLEDIPFEVARAGLTYNGILVVVVGPVRDNPVERGKDTPVVGTTSKDRWKRNDNLIFLSCLDRKSLPVILIVGSEGCALVLQDRETVNLSALTSTTTTSHGSTDWHNLDDVHQRCLLIGQHGFGLGILGRNRRGMYHTYRAPSNITLNNSNSFLFYVAR